MKIEDKTSILKLLVVQQLNRAYRIPLLKKLSNIPLIELTMLYGTNKPVQPGDVGVSIYEDELPFRSIGLPIGGIRYKTREILWFNNAINILKKEYFDIVITDHYTRMLSIWPMQSIQHRRGAGFILWGIGFHQHSTPMINIIRKLMVKRTDALLLYSNNEKIGYYKMGVPIEKCFVTQNTVDIEGIDAAIESATPNQIQYCKNRIRCVEGPILMHVGRLAMNKRLDILIKTLPQLSQKWRDIQLVLIGEGPELDNLKNFSKEVNVADRVHFIGAITDHKLLAPWVLSSDLFVAPAQIGLMAPMCLIYNKTLVISNELQQHGPEVQFFEPGHTGLDYPYGNVDALAATINTLLENPKTCIQLAKNGSHRVRKAMGPEQMIDAFLQAINYVTGRNIII